MTALEHSANRQTAAAVLDQPDSTDTMQLLIRPLQILLAALLVYFVRMLWRHWLESMRPTVQQYRHRHDGSYNVPHTVVRWSDKRVARTAADAEDGNCISGVHDGLYPGESRCAFLDEHKGTFDPSATLKSGSGSKSSSTVQLRTYSVQPRSRIGNGFSDPHRVRALLIWVGDVPVGSRHAAHLAHRCAGMGVAFRSMDHRGFGESEGPTGTVDSWQRMVDEQAAFVAHAYNQQTAQNADEASTGATPLPLFLGGMGFGATIALILATRMGPARVAGLLLLSPAIQLGISPRLQSVAKSLGRLAPWLRCVPLTEISMLSRNLAVPAHLHACGGLGFPDAPSSLLSVGTVSELIRLCEHAQSRLSQLRDVPYLVQHGVRDMVCLSSGTHQLMLDTDGVCGAAHSLRALSGSWHDLLHEAEGQQVIDDMVEWLDDRINCLQLRQTLD